MPNNDSNPPIRLVSDRYGRTWSAIEVLITAAREVVQEAAGGRAVNPHTLEVLRAALGGVDTARKEAPDADSVHDTEH